MASIPIVIASNFDGAPEDYKLDHEHKREVDSRRKYAHGVTTSPFGRQRPVAPLSATAARAVKRSDTTYVPYHKIAGKYAGLAKGEALNSDSSGAEDVEEPSAAPEPDAEITYSYDLPRGPTAGGEILSMAISKAVERFETKETEKLVKNEYNFVMKEEDEEHGGYTADDDFELV